MANAIRNAHRSANRALAKLDTYHVGLPLSQIGEALSANGLNCPDFDATGIYCGRNGEFRGEVFFRHMPDDDDIVTGSFLVFTWHKMEESGRYEVIAYLS